MVKVTDVIDCLNIGGRQGPQSLLSYECYEWVRGRMEITISEYRKIIEGNAIPDTERGKNRNACFVLKNGRVTLFKSSEEELRPYVCLAVSRLSPPVTSDRVIAAAKALYPAFTPVDLMNQHNLTSPQPRIDQTIRNILVSNYERPNNKRLFLRGRGTSYTYSLTPAGKTLAAKALASLTGIRLRLDEEEPPLKAGPSLGVYTDEELARRAARPYRYDPGKGNMAPGGRRATDKTLLNTVILSSGCRCAVDGSHKTFEGAAGLPNFLEGHHLVPLSLQPLFPDIDLDCPENIVPLCPNCHRALHYGTAFVRRETLDKISSAHRGGLLGIGIPEEILAEIFWRYYLCEYK